jgi:chromosome segregation ATPase
LDIAPSVPTKPITAATAALPPLIELEETKRALEEELAKRRDFEGKIEDLKAHLERRCAEIANVREIARAEIDETTARLEQAHEVCEGLHAELKRERRRTNAMMHGIAEWAGGMIRKTAVLDEARCRLETYARQLAVLRDQVLDTAMAVKARGEALADRDVILSKHRAELDRMRRQTAETVGRMKEEMQRRMEDAAEMATQKDEDIAALGEELRAKDADIARLSDAVDRVREREAVATHAASELETIVKALRSKHRSVIGKAKEDLKASEERERALEEKLLYATSRIHDLEAEKDKLESQGKCESMRVTEATEALRRKVRELTEENETLRAAADEQEQEIVKREKAASDAEAAVRQTNREMFDLRRAFEAVGIEAKQHAERAESLAKELDDTEAVLSRVQARVDDVEAEARKQHRSLKN